MYSSNLICSDADPRAELFHSTRGVMVLYMGAGGSRCVESVMWRAFHPGSAAERLSRGNVPDEVILGPKATGGQLHSVFAKIIE